MVKDKIIEKVLKDMAIDPRITDGIFDIAKNEHVGYLSEYLIKKGIESEIVYEFCDLLMEKGKFPERQAYNRKGILVTFPTPEYKKAAIQAGTHFEDDPTRGRPNVFSNGNTPPATAPPPTSGPTKTNLPVSTSASTPPPAEKDGEETSEPAQPIPNAFTTAAPQQSPSAGTPTEPTKLPPPQPDPPAEKQANKNVIKQILKGDDYMLDEVIEYIMNNAPHIVENISRKRYE